MGSLSGGGTNFAESTVGKTRLLICPTDASGYIQWYPQWGISGTDQYDIELLGYISEYVYPPTVVAVYPEGTTTELDKIGIVISDDFGLDLTTLDLSATLSNGVVLNAVVGGAMQADWGGQILTDGLANPKWLELQVTSWPDEISPGILVSFSADVENITGESI
jgi:hypothetical protein